MSDIRTRPGHPDSQGGVAEARPRTAKWDVTFVRSMRLLAGLWFRGDRARNGLTTAHSVAG